MLKSFSLGRSLADNGNARHGDAYPMSERAKALWELIRTEELPELGSGPRHGVLAFPTLAGRFDAWAASAGLNPHQAARLRAIAYLHHDHTDAAHDLVQDMADPDGALVHGILHRREPDFWNAKYWFRQTENHPVYQKIAARIQSLSSDPQTRAIVHRLTLPGTLDPHALVDEVERVERRPVSDPDVHFLRHVQLAETECLVEHLLG